MHAILGVQGSTWMMKPNTKTATAISIAIFIIITIIACSIVPTVESKEPLTSQSTILPLSLLASQTSALITETTQCPMSPVQAAYGTAAALIALGVIVLMLIREKRNTIRPETIL